MENNWMRNVFYKRLPENRQPEIRTVFPALYPGEDTNKRYREYRKQKRLIAIVMILIGVGMFVCSQVSSHMQSRLKDGTHLTRNEWGEGNYFVTLQAKTVSEEGELTYQIKERVFTEEELDVLLRQAGEELTYAIKAENESLQHVTKNLNLVNALEGYPFSIAWRSSDYDKIRTDGTVELSKVTEQGENIRLTAIFAYEDYVREMDVDVRLLQPAKSEKERYLQKITDLLEEKDLLSASENRFVLPDKMGGEEIRWQEKKADGSFVWLFLGGVCAFLCTCKMDSDLQKKNQDRKEEMVRSYPEFVSKLKLYMGAGLTIRNAFLRIGRDYRQEKQRTGKKEYLYEEVLLSGYQLANGKSEEYVYREWGRRCEVMCCRKLGFLLTSTLRQGNEKILFVLDKEACFAWEERKAKVKKRGEEAGTKMLFPMLLMLLMVMFLILLPAFSGLHA